MLKSGHCNACSVDQFTTTIDACLQRWGRYSYPHYAALQPLVDLELAIVERRARKEVLRGRFSGHVTNKDRQYAVWTVLKDVIDSLCPRSSRLANIYRRALEKIPETGWPSGLVVPQELYFYLLLHLAYVVKTYNNARLALLFQVAPRTLAGIRGDAVEALAARVYALEQQCRLSHHRAS